MLEASRTGCSIQDLLTEVEASDKTIRRDLKVLATVFEITSAVGEGRIKRWKMKPLAEQLGFNYTELLSIHMSQQFMEPLAGTPFWEGNRAFFARSKARSATMPFVTSKS